MIILTLYKVLFIIIAEISLYDGVPITLQTRADCGVPPNTEGQQKKQN